MGPAFGGPRHTSHSDSVIEHIFETGLGRHGEGVAFDIAVTSGVSVTPLQSVRLSTARAHILLSDRATSTEGLALLEQAAWLAGANGLSHQLRSIQSIRQAAAGRAGRA